MAQEYDGTHEATEHFLKEGLSLAVQLIAHNRRKREMALREAREEGRLAEIDTLRRQALDTSVDAQTLAKVTTDEWWQKSSDKQKIETYVKVADGADSSPLAAVALQSMNKQFKERYGFDVADLKTNAVPEDEIESFFTEHLARNREAQRETTGAEDLGVAQPARDDRLHQVGTLTAATGLDEKEAALLVDIHQLGMARMLSDISHVGDIQDVAEAGAVGADEPQARKASLGVKRSAQRDQGR